MNTKQIYFFVSVLALASAFALAAMLVVAFTQGGVTAQHFENFFEPQQYADELLRYETGLRAILAIDALFLVLYTATVIFLALAIREEKNSILVAVSIFALLIATFLDIHENTDLLVFIQMAKENLVPSAEQLHSRALWSGVKFQASYLSFFLLAFVLPSKTFLEKFLRWSLWLGYVPVGILVYTFPNPLFSWARYLFMLSGLLILFWNFYIRSKKAK